MKKISLLFAFCSVILFTFGQSNKNEQNKICIDSIHTNLLIGKWYDFSTDFYVEQVNFIKTYYKEPKHLRDSTSFKGFIIFNLDGTFEATKKSKDLSYIKHLGTWMVVPKTRHLKLVYVDSEFPSQIWTVLELNREAFIIKRGTKQ